MKTVAVASGKGGSGKTTLTSLLFHFARKEFKVVLADADVEASNLPIALGVTDVECESFEGGSTASVDLDLCTGCGMCMGVCRFGAISVQMDMDTMSLQCKIDGWACEGCGHCTYVCAWSALHMEPSSAGSACTAMAGETPLSYGQLGPGEDLSGRLVNMVRKRAVAQAKDCDADLILIDGPPGIGCPAISAIADVDLLVAVTEPTVSGRHDLDRLLQLASRFDLECVVVLNKADLSAQGSESIRAYCERAGVELLAELPFDESLAGMLFEGDPTVDHSAQDSPAIEQVRLLWQRLASRPSVTP